jgi:arginyl-tRNA synthetase
MVVLKLKKFKETISALISGVLGVDQFEVYKFLSIPPDPSKGDLAFPCFKFAKDKGQKPNDFAIELDNKLSPILSSVEEVSSAKVFGPYLNFFMNKNIFFNTVLSDALNKKKDRELKKGESGTIVIDYSSPNIAKPIAFHHIRSTVIGNVLGNIFERNGYKVIRINYLGDWGTQFGKLITAFEKYGDDKKLLSEGILHLLDIYVKYHQKNESSDSDSLARKWFKEMENGNPKALEYWKKFREISLKEFDRVYKRLGVSFTNIEGESFYNDVSEETIKEVDIKTGTSESQGAIVVDLNSYNMPPVLLKKMDGTTLYATRDISAAIDRWKRFSFTESLYVVASQQELHFKQIFKVFELMGYEWASRCKHVQFGLLHLEDSKMSTRSGNIIFLEDVLDKAVVLARKAIEDKNPELPNKDEVAEAVGVGSVIFGDISKRRVQDISFRWDDILNFDGDTAPYVQYTHARACSILSKTNFVSETTIKAKINYTPSDTELALAKLLSEFEEKLELAQLEYEPFVLARYILDVCKEFNRYYYQDKIVDIEDQEIKHLKLCLVYAVKERIKDCLGILGIKAPERM